MKKSGRPRFGELDFLRGLAIVSMVGLHTFEDLLFVNGSRFLDATINQYWQRVTAILFLVIFGIAASLNYISNGSQSSFRSWLRRGAVLLGWGMLITLVTFIYLRKGFVIFGILHLMGASSILIYPLLPFKYWNLILGVLVMLVGNYLDTLSFTFNWLVWLGLIPKGFSSVDYFPIAPWLGYILIGIFLGKVIYPEGKPRLNLKVFSNNLFVKGICFLGRKSLLIYLVHQPLLLAGILIGSLIRNG